MLKKDAGGSRAAMKRKKKSLSVNMETAPSGKGAKKSKPSLAASSSSSSSSSAGGATDRTTERTKVSEYVVKYDEPDIRGKSVLDILGLDEPDEVLSQAKANMLLSKIIAPTTRESFYKESWETAPLHIERDSSAHFKGLFNKKSFTSILENQTSYLGEDIEINKYANGTLKTLNGQVAGEVDGAIMLEEEATVREGQQVQKEAVEVKRADIFAHLKENYTVRLLCPQKYDDLLWGFLAILEQEFGSRVGCHADLTPQGAQGFGVTADSSDSFVIQLKDEAKWSLYAPQPGMELMMESTVEIASESLPDKPTQERVLKAGDSLYIPKGWGYASKCVSDNDDFSGQSLHLRVFTNHKNSIIDLLDRVVPNAVTVIASEHVSVRKGLPFNYMEYLGMPHSETEGDAKRAAFNKRFKKLLAAVMEASLSLIDVGADQMAKKFISERLPVPISEFEESRSANGAPDARLFSYTNLRMLRPGIARAIVEDNQVVVYHCMDNSREIFGTPLQPLEFELDDGPAIEALLGAYPKAIVISDLPHPSEEEEDKLEVATALYKEGFLLIDDEASKPAGAVDRDGGESDDSDDPF